MRLGGSNPKRVNNTNFEEIIFLKISHDCNSQDFAIYFFQALRAIKSLFVFESKLNRIQVHLNNHFLQISLVTDFITSCPPRQVLFNSSHKISPSEHPSGLLGGVQHVSQTSRCFGVGRKIFLFI